MNREDRVLPVQNFFNSRQNLFNMHQQDATARVTKSIPEMNKAITCLQPIKSNARPRSKVIFSNLIVVYFEPAIAKKRLACG